MVTFHQPWGECATTHAHTLLKAPSKYNDKGRKRPEYEMSQFISEISRLTPQIRPPMKNLFHGMELKENINNFETIIDMKIVNDIEKEITGTDETLRNGKLHYIKRCDD